MPSGHFRAYIEHYFVPHPSREAKGLFASRAILDLAAGASVLFEPIYLWSNGLSAAQVLLFFAAIYTLYFFALPLGGRICRRHGYEHTILFSSPFLILWYLGLLATPYHPGFLVVAGVALVIQKILYWPGYHADFISRIPLSDEGRGISTVAALAGLGSAFAPAFGGLVVVFGGYPSLFIMVIALILLSNIPLLKTPELFLPRPFPYWAAFARLIAPSRRRKLITYFGFGEELIAMIAWPVFIAMMVPDARLLGAVISGAMLVNVVVTLYVGRLSDGDGRGKLLRIGALHTALSWAARPFISGGFGVFLVDTFYRTAKNMVNVPVLAGAYDDARKGDPMEEVVFFEMALAVGKVLAALVTAAALTWIPNPWTAIFAVATLFTAMYSVTSRSEAARV